MQHVLVDGLCATCQPVLRAFNPSEPRIPGGEHGGEWGHGFGHALEDELQLAGRIHLDPGEQLVSSSRLDNSSGADVDLLFAVIHSPYGNEVRIGAIPSDDAGKWTAEAKGATAGLASDELRQARTDIAAGAAAADKAASAAAAAWKSGHAPTDPKMLGAEPVASGTLGSHGNHDELDWKIYVNDQSSWDLSITATRGEFNGAVLDPTETGDLLTHLGDIQGQLDYSGHSAVAPVQRSISLDRHVLVDGECTTCSRSQPSVDEPPQHLHVLDNGICTTCDPEDLLDEDSAALLQALNEMDGPPGETQRAAFDPSKHLRNPKGPGGGRFRSNVDKLKDAIASHRAGTHEGHPFDGFDREQLRKVAKARGIEMKRGESRDSISAKLLAHLGGGKKDESKKGDMAAALEKVGLTPADVAKRPAKKATPKPPVTEAPKSGKKKLDDKYLSISQTPVTTAEDPELRDSLAAMFEYHDPQTGFRTVLDRGESDFGDVAAHLSILDADGHKIGKAVRHISGVQPGMQHFTGGAPVGSRVVEHSLFILDRRNPPIQGGGFATRWLNAAEQEYRANDIHSITLHADIDVGGYAWAKMGFDFKHAGDAKFLAENGLRHQMALAHDPAALEAAQKLVDRVEAGDTPLPVEFAMVGWAPGKKTWLGKQAMLGSDWQGVKRL